MNKSLLIDIVDMVQTFTLAQTRRDRVQQTYILPNGNSVSVATEMSHPGFLTTMAIDADGTDGAVEGWQTPLDVAERMITLAEAE